MTGAELAACCKAARDAGMDFAAVWQEILKESPLVIGPPLQTMRAGHLQLEVPLASGESIAFEAALTFVDA